MSGPYDASINHRAVYSAASETQRLRQEAARDYRRIAELEAENLRLQCCGNCAEFCHDYDFDYCPEWARLDPRHYGVVDSHRNCHFDPSQWKFEAERKDP